MQANRIRVASAGLGIILWLALNQMAPAQQASDQAEPRGVFVPLDMVVYAPTKRTIELRKAPGAVTVITAEQISQLSARTLIDVLRLVPGFNARITPMGAAFAVRSFGDSPFTERVLLLIDGAPYNSPDKGGLPAHPGFDLFPVEHIKRIEVIRGPGSAVYGANAFWGVINIITKRGADFENTELRVVGGGRDTQKFTISHGMAQGDVEWSVTANLRQETSPLRFLRDVEYRYFDIYSDLRKGPVSLSIYNHWDSSSPFLMDKNVLNKAGNSIEQKTAGTAQLITIADLTFDHRLSSQVDLQAKLFFNRREGNTCASCHNPGSFNEPYDVTFEKEINQRGFASVQVNYNPTPHHLQTFGIEFTVDRIKKRVLMRPDADPQVTNVAIFTSQEVRISQDRVIATFGARYDQNEITDSSLSPRVSLVAEPLRGLILRSDFATAFRAPTWNDLFINHQLTPDSGGVRYLGNPDLKNEKIVAVEAGFEYWFSGNSAFKAIGFYDVVSDFITVFDNEIRPGIFQFRNATGDAKISGGEVELQLELSRTASGFVNYSYQRTRLPNGQTRPAFAPKHKGAFGLSVSVSPNLRFSTQGSYWGSFYPSSRERKRKVDRFGPYALLDATVTALFPWQFGRLEVSGILTNLLDDTTPQTPIRHDIHHAKGEKHKHPIAPYVGRTFYGQLKFIF
jgi:iron complex outermembrane receptor protein